jgi:hypothetical protein
MWKMLLGFIVFAALAVFVLMKSGGNVDMSGEKHGIETPEATTETASASASASAPTSAPVAPASEAASAQAPASAASN